jgi:hypothetical protein
MEQVFQKMVDMEHTFHILPYDVKYASQSSEGPRRQLADLYRSGAIEAIYDRWFMRPSPPRDQILNFPMGAAMQRAIAQPTDSPTPGADT